MGFPLLLPARAAQAHASRRPQAAKHPHAPGACALCVKRNTARAAQAHASRRPQAAKLPCAPGRVHFA